MNNSDKRYQVFVSSTYADLQEERSMVVQTLMSLDCIPAGMELFPAVDQEQFDFIKRVIDDCDYYVLIIGGRYGSLSDSGISYTEMEYDYAVSKGIKIIALLHAKPEEIPVGKSEKDIKLKKKLDTFREKAKKGRLVKFWDKPDNLISQFMASLVQTIKLYPAVGWVRANSLMDPGIYKENSELRKENQELRAELNQQSTSSNFNDIAELDEEFRVYGAYLDANDRINWIRWTGEITWKSLFHYLAPRIDGETLEDSIKELITNYAFNTTNPEIKYDQKVINKDLFYTIKIQLKALGLIQESNYNGRIYWALTEDGYTKMIELRVIRTKK